jgi:hypothetical protein
LIKKRKEKVMDCSFYGRFLTSKTITAPIIAIAIMIAIAEPKTYVSVIDFSAGVGTSVA